MLDSRYNLDASLIAQIGSDSSVVLDNIDISIEPYVGYDEVIWVNLTNGGAVLFVDAYIEPYHDIFYAQK